MRFSWPYSWLGLRKLSRRQRRCLKRKRTYIPLRVERLEDRLAPTVDTWTAGAGTLNWTDAANWSAGAVPISTDDVQINTAVSGPIVINIASAANRTIHPLMDTTASMRITGGSLTLTTDSSASQNLTVSGGTLTASGQLIVGGSLNESGGTLTGAGTVTVTGQTVWTGGTMSGSSTTVAQGGLQLGVADNNNHDETLNGRTFENQGNASWLSSSGHSSNMHQQSGSTFDNEAGATLDIQTNSSWTDDNNNSTFTNQGTLQVAAGSGSSPTIRPAFSNSGSVQVQSGSLSLQGGGSDSGALTVETGATLDLVDRHYSVDGYRR